MARSTRASIGALALAVALITPACGTGERDIEPDGASAAGARAKAGEAERERYAVGAAAYAKYCALCHGKDATGYAADHAPSLVSATFLESASNEFLARGIREGRPGTAMAGYAKARGGPLDDEEVFAIITFLRGEDGAPRPRLPAAAAVGDPARGEAVYAEHCQRCHGTRAERGYAVHLANTALLSAASDPFLRHAVVHGRPGTPMIGFQYALTDAQIDDVVALVRSWARPPDPPRKAPPEPPPLGEVVINPSGPHPEFTLRADRYVPIDDVKRALDAKKRMVIIDARAASDWLTMHIPGSISVPYYLFTRLDALPRDGTWIMAYCACPHHASGVVVDELRRRGFTHTAVLDEGILEWKKRGYPTESEPAAPDAPAPVGKPLPSR